VETREGPKTTPDAFPRSQGLEQAVRHGVREELDRLGIGGGGGDGGDRLAKIEQKLAVIEATMVTKADLEKQLGEIRSVISTMPLTLIKWLGGLFPIIAGVMGAVVWIVLHIVGKP
jgi:hypothetical protein